MLLWCLPRFSLRRPPPPSLSVDTTGKDNGGCATSTHEIACSYPQAGITSGGGFSAYAARPAWQDDAVTAYLKKDGKGLRPWWQQPSFFQVWA